MQKQKTRCRHSWHSSSKAPGDETWRLHVVPIHPALPSTFPEEERESKAIAAHGASSPSTKMSSHRRRSCRAHTSGPSKATKASPLILAVALLFQKKGVQSDEQGRPKTKEAQQRPPTHSPLSPRESRREAQTPTVAAEMPKASTLKLTSASATALLNETPLKGPPSAPPELLALRALPQNQAATKRPLYLHHKARAAPRTQGKRG